MGWENHNKSFVFAKFSHRYSFSVLEIAKKNLNNYSFIKPLVGKKITNIYLLKKKTTFKDDQVVYYSNAQQC